MLHKYLLKKNVCIMCIIYIYMVLKEKLLYKYVCFWWLFYTQVQEGNAFYKYGDIIQFQEPDVHYQKPLHMFLSDIT